MRTNIEIDDALMDAAMRAGPYKTKKEAVEEGLKLLARKAAYRDILALKGKLRWDDLPAASTLLVSEAAASYGVAPKPATPKRRKR